MSIEEIAESFDLIQVATVLWIVGVPSDALVMTLVLLDACGYHDLEISDHGNLYTIAVYL